MEKEDINMEQVYSNFGITIIKREGNYFMQYDNGEMASTIKEIEISEREAYEIQEQKDETAIYEYMIRNLCDRI